MEKDQLDPNIRIKIADLEDYFDLTLCAKEFIELIDNFKNRFINKKFFILTAYYENILGGVLVAENKLHKVDSLEKLIPTMCIYLLFVNPRYQNKHIGKKLLNTFITIQKENGIASVYIKLPLIYKNGIRFFLNNQFREVNRYRGKIFLERRIWNDYGITDCHHIEDSFNDLFG